MNPSIIDKLVGLDTLSVGAGLNVLIKQSVPKSEIPLSIAKRLKGIGMIQGREDQYVLTPGAVPGSPAGPTLSQLWDLQSDYQRRAEQAIKQKIREERTK